MSFGKMNTKISIVETTNAKDSQGFRTPQTTVLATVRAYREGRHGSEKWANLSTFSEATDLFRFRVIPHLDVTTKHKLVCGDDTFDIISAENVKGRGMYIEVLGKCVKSGK